MILFVGLPFEGRKDAHEAAVDAVLPSKSTIRGEAIVCREDEVDDLARSRPLSTECRRHDELARRGRVLHIVVAV